MPAAAIATIILAVVVVLVLAIALLAIARVLVDVNKQLGAVIGAVGEITARTEPVNDVVGSIDTDLGTARDVLTSLLESKVGADGAAELIASVDPLAAAQAEADHTIRYSRQEEPPPPPASAGARASLLPVEPPTEAEPTGPAPAEPVFDDPEPPTRSSFSGGGGIRFGADEWPESEFATPTPPEPEVQAPADPEAQAPPEPEPEAELPQAPAVEGQPEPEGDPRRFSGGGPIRFGDDAGS